MSLALRQKKVLSANFLGRPDDTQFYGPAFPSDKRITRNMQNHPENVTIRSFDLVSQGQPLEKRERVFLSSTLRPDDALIQIAGCGVCHTDLGFIYDGVRTGSPLPLTLGHEISGVVVQAGQNRQALIGQKVVVPAVIPCGECLLCKKGRGSICRKQIFPGSDVAGGFASHLVVPGHCLCVVDEAMLSQSGLTLPDLSVLADAVSTPYQAVVRSGLGKGDTAIVVGAGGVGGFAVQIAHALGANVIALDVSEERLSAISAYGAKHCVCTKGRDPNDVRKEISAYVKAQGLNPLEWKIFECSGHPGGQTQAFTLLTFGAFLSVVGYTLEKVQLRISNLMAFDATAQGNWGCVPSLYPDALQLILSSQIKLLPFIERRPLSSINTTVHELHDGLLRKRPVLVPDFS